MSHSVFGALLLSAASLLVAVPTVAAQTADDWAVTRDPFDKSVIARYKAILAKNPHDASALAKLLEMYRRYRTVDLLRSEYQKLADGASGATALVVLARIDKFTGDTTRALQTLRNASADRSSDAELWVLIGDLAKASDAAGARIAYDKAMGLSAPLALRKRALRALADLALASNDIDAANAYFKKYLELEPKNAQLWLERGDAMLAAKKHELALESYNAAEKLLGSDPARRMEVVSRRGQAFDAMGQLDRAVEEYQRAIKVAPKGYYLEVELTNRIVDIYRRKQDLPGLLATYEAQWRVTARGHFEWSTLGKLYEETGGQDKAIAAFKQAAAKAPWEIDTQRRLIALLENSGRDDEALAQFEAVVRAAPGEARFSLDLAERYWRRGKQPLALAALKKIEGRFGGDAGVLSAVADMYQRWGQEAAAIAVFEKLAKLEPDDPNHLISLGEQYNVKGEKNRALDTWRKIGEAKTAKAYARLGEVLAEHARPDEALENFAKALKLEPQNPEIYKARAVVQEGEKKFAEAAADWEKVLSLLTTKAAGATTAANQRSLGSSARREARKRLVQVVVRWGVQKTDLYRGRWLAAFTQKPADLDAGYCLAELFTKAPFGGEPLNTLQKLVALVPDDQELLLDLVKAYRQHRRFDDAVALLLRLTEIAPSREREAFTQIAEIKSEARLDQEAIEWSQKALAKSPNDPVAYERMGQRYVEMQKLPEAIAAYEKATSLDPKNTKTQFALAELYIRSNAALKATALYRHVMRNSTDDEIIRRAGRNAIDLEEMTSTLGELERVLSPLTFVMSHKPVYRHVLVDLLVRYVPILVERERNGDPAIASAAAVELGRLGSTGLRPLLEALRDDKDPFEQRRAVDVIGHLRNRDAAQPLLRVANAPSASDPTIRTTAAAQVVDRELRVAAVLAAGRLGDNNATADLIELAENERPEMRQAALFALARAGNPRTVATLTKHLEDQDSDAQALACLGLANATDARTNAALVVVAKDRNRADLVRGACTWALATSRSPSNEAVLIDLVASGAAHTKRLAAWGLAALNSQRSVPVLLHAYFARGGDAELAAGDLVTALAQLTGPRPSAGSQTISAPRQRNRVDVATIVAQLPSESPRLTLSVAWLTSNADHVATAIVDALTQHRDIALGALTDLDGAQSGLALGALLQPRDLAVREADAALTKIARAIEPAVRNAAVHPDSKVRMRAISLLGKIGTGNASAAIVLRAFDDPAESVVLAAIAASSHWLQREAAVELRARLHGLTATQAWQVRAAAVAAAAACGALSESEIAVLARAPSAIVRQAVATGVPLTKAASWPLLRQLAGDPVPHVRAAVASRLAALNDLRATSLRAALLGDPNPLVRAAADKKQ
ncbi:MAG: HEAT repeat domain-containing protein [Kofleriaceae bacterium]|nr:HEAT repeat domain-containing protein [Kofleriaceae bacterium]